MKKKIWLLRGIVVTLVACILIAVVFAVSMGDVSAKLTGTQSSTISAMIDRTIVTCYAVEGRYPPSLEYLEENYGLTLDKKTYDYEYSIIAHNIRPTVEVTRREAQ